MEQPPEISASEYTMGKRLNKTTINGYQSKLNTMSVILLKHDLHEYLDPESSKPVIPSPNNVIEDLFGWISTHTDISLRFRKACWSDRFVRRKQRTCAVSTMQGFKSALLWSYWKAKVPFL